MNSAQVSARGFEFDRQWMLVDKHGDFLSQRTLPKMALIQPSLIGKHLVLDAPGMLRLWTSISGNPGEAKVIEVRVHKDTCQGIDQGEKVAWWFSTFLELECTLVRMADDDVRPVKGDITNGQVGFADDYPFLIISQASLDELNEIIGNQQVAMDRFRPNIVVTEADPHEEDTWEEIKIGEVSLLGKELCKRCNVPNVNQETGEIDKDLLRILGSYRFMTSVSPDGRKKNGVFFGRNFIHQSHGEIQVGDMVTVLTTV